MRILLCFLLAGSCFAHRLDEYLQATMLTVEKDRVVTSMRLIPGVAVAPAVLASIDTNGDGVISSQEQQAYALRVLGDVALSVDGERLNLKLASVSFPEAGEMKEGLGEIQMEFAAQLPAGGGQRKLVFENHHQRRISAYLVNCLVPRDKNVQIGSQVRNYDQSFYQVDYIDGGSKNGAFGQRNHWDTHSSFRHAGLFFWSGMVVRNLGARPGFRSLRQSIGAFPSMFRLGMRHIAEGTDHLLFLLTLLLPAPLLVLGSRWAGFGGVRHGLLRILRVVTAFTVGHSLTLAMAALGLVRVPSGPIEVLIAVSILVSAIHAMRPLFAGREARIAAFFGLIHGLAFAATLGNLGLGLWERVVSILGFNLGIETMQLLVVAAVMPPLVLLSRTRVYPVMRIGGALFAGAAAMEWIAERLLDMGVAPFAVWIAAGLLLTITCAILLRNAISTAGLRFGLRPFGSNNLCVESRPDI
jgi:hypothetical protein